MQSTSGEGRAPQNLSELTSDSTTKTDASNSSESEKSELEQVLDKLNEVVTKASAHREAMIELDRRWAEWPPTQRYQALEEGSVQLRDYHLDALHFALLFGRQFSGMLAMNPHDLDMETFQLKITETSNRLLDELSDNDFFKLRSGIKQARPLFEVLETAAARRVGHRLGVEIPELPSIFPAHIHRAPYGR